MRIDSSPQNVRRRPRRSVRKVLGSTGLAVLASLGCGLLSVAWKGQNATMDKSLPDRPRSEDLRDLITGRAASRWIGTG
jgi:hypothetical protein